MNILLTIVAVISIVTAVYAVVKAVEYKRHYYQRSFPYLVEKQEYLIEKLNYQAIVSENKKIVANDMNYISDSAVKALKQQIADTTYIDSKLEKNQDGDLVYTAAAFIVRKKK